MTEIEPRPIEDFLLLRLIDFVIDEVPPCDLEDPLRRINEQGWLGVIRGHGVSFL